MKATNLVKVTLIGMAGLLAACVAQPENAMLQEARQTYAEARNNPQVMNNAPLELNQAGESLQKAEQLKEQDAEEVVVTHQAYLAKQKTEIARQRAELELAQKAIEEADAQRKEVLLEVRSRELQEAKQTAAARQKELEAAQMTKEERAQELERLRSELQNIQSAKQTDRGIVLTLGDVLFDFNKAELKPGARKTIETLSNFLQEYPERKVMIEGYTDSIGSEEYNQKLSEERAQSVKDALTSMGISPDRIQTRGYGEQYPVASNDNPAGRQLNRRVEIVISSGNEEISTREGEES